MSRNLDAAVARALGREVVERGGEYWYGGGVSHRVEPFSECGEAMLELDKEMWARGWTLFVMRSEPEEGDEHITVTYMAIWDDTTGPQAKKSKVWVDTTIPKAVALCAYYALTGKEWSE